jgi:hypothetical protein
MTAQEEKKKRDAEKAKRSRVYRFEPVLFDRLNPPAGRDIKPGELVVKIQPYGCPRNGTMGMCYAAIETQGNLSGWFVKIP